jgi:hypothetical protein
VSRADSPDVVSWKQDSDTLDLFTQVGAEVANIAGQQVSGPRFDGSQQDWYIFFGQSNSSWKSPLSRIEQVDRSCQLGQPHALIFLREVDSCFFQCEVGTAQRHALKFQSWRSRASIL